MNRTPDDENLRAYMEAKDERIMKHHGEVAVFYKGRLVTVQGDVEEAMPTLRRRSTVGTSCRNSIPRKSRPLLSCDRITDALLDYQDDVPLVPVRIAGKGLSISRFALIDTGAKYCVLHETLSRVLGLEAILELQCLTFSNIADAIEVIFETSWFASMKIDAVMSAATFVP